MNKKTYNKYKNSLPQMNYVLNTNIDNNIIIVGLKTDLNQTGLVTFLNKEKYCTEILDNVKNNYICIDILKM